MMKFNADHCIWARKHFLYIRLHNSQLEDGCLRGIYIISFPFIFLLIELVVYYVIA